MTGDPDSTDEVPSLVDFRNVIVLEQRERSPPDLVECWALRVTGEQRQASHDTYTSTKRLGPRAQAEHHRSDNLVSQPTQTGEGGT